MTSSIRFRMVPFLLIATLAGLLAACAARLASPPPAAPTEDARQPTTLPTPPPTETAVIGYYVGDWT